MTSDFMTNSYVHKTLMIICMVHFGDTQYRCSVEQGHMRDIYIELSPNDEWMYIVEESCITLNLATPAKCCIPMKVITEMSTLF